MADFEYGNARLRAMKSRQLSRRTLEELAEIRTVEGLITALAETAYRESIEAALVRLRGMECLAEALRASLVATVGKTRSFFSGGAGQLAALALGRYDLHNLKTILRGQMREAPTNEIMANLLPVGELRPADLAELARAPGVRAVMDLLATWRTPWASPLLEARGEAMPDPRRGFPQNGNADLARMELALDRWYLHSALQAALRAAEDGRALYEALLLEADTANVLSVLRLAGAPEIESTLREQFGPGGMAALLVGPGQIAPEVLVRAAQKESVGAAVEALAQTPVGATLAGAQEAFAASPRLSVFERALRLRQLKHAIRWLTGDPLGIGVLVGCVALKTNEVSNLRAIAQGLALGEKPGPIRSELMFAD
jgi:vacuolar-type H+-ATPase subunit C/Vma6